MLRFQLPLEIPGFEFTNENTHNSAPGSAIQRITGWRTQVSLPVVFSYQRRFMGSVATPSWTS